MDPKQLQAEVNDQIALTIGRQAVELMIAQATIAALQRALADQKEPKPEGHS